jgi:hypothetical protein
MEIGKPIKFKVINLAFDSVRSSVTSSVGNSVWRSVWRSVLNSVSRPTRNIRHGNR